MSDCIYKLQLQKLLAAQDDIDLAFELGVDFLHLAFDDVQFFMIFFNFSDVVLN